ncbi:MAG: hypothetical protein NXI00_02865 [Cytophagales bacterium]|nr:hypothetical protein [Cytophagales bacterium]
MKNQQVNIKTQIEKMYIQRKEILRRSYEKIRFSEPLISKDDLGIIYPNTITTIQGQKGVHKSRVTEAFCARVLDTSNTNEHLGMDLKTKENIFLLYVDSERNHKDQLPYAVQKIRKKAGYRIDEIVPNFDILSLINVARSNRFEALNNHIKRLQEENPKEHIMIVFDVITDCIGSFNDVNQSMLLIDLMNDLINTSNVSFITVIHENPKGDKARGHLGTEIINKSSQVIQISMEGQLIKVKFLHSRNTGKIPEWNLEFDKKTNGLVQARNSTILGAMNKKQNAAPIEDLQKFILALGNNTFDKKDLIEKIKTNFEVGTRTLEDRLNTLKKLGIIKSVMVGNKSKITIYSDKQMQLL